MKIKVESVMAIVSKTFVETGYEFSLKEILDLISYTERKCQLNKKGEEYFAILFENELKDFIIRNQINRKGENKRCVHHATAPLV